MATWSFSPRPSLEVRPAEETAFRRGLGSALRTAHGLRVAIGLELRSGPEPRLLVAAQDPVTARWMTRVLARSYGPTQWVPEPSSPHPNATASAFLAHRIFDWPEPFGSFGSRESALDGWVAALSTAPAGIVLRWRWTSRPVPVPHWWDRPPREAMAFSDPMRSSSLGRRDPAIRRPETSLASRPLFGNVQLSVTFEKDSPRLDRRGLLSALEAVARSERGNGVVFRPVSKFPGRNACVDRGMIVSVEEWERFWPHPECPALGERETTEPGSWILPLGRVSTGAVVGPRLEAGQGRHMAVLGETGMGKSSLLVAVGRRVFATHGGVVFDPLGETVRSLRAELGSDGRTRLLWIAPETATVGVNALEGIGPGPSSDPIRSERRLNDLVHALRRVRAGRYEESAYWGPRLEEMVTRAIRAAAALPRGTLADAHTLLATSGRLGRPVPDPAMEPIRELADRIRDRPEDADGARRLLHEVVRSPVLLRMLCEPEPPLRTRDLVAPGRIVLISGDAARIGESTARYLLSVYFALVWSELLAREEAPKTFVVLDEAQWFSHESLGEMLRLGRRRNVHVILATQAVGSLPPAVAEAVWTNVSDFVAFRGSPEEAREFSRASRGVPAEDLLSLPRGEAAVLLGKGHFVRWVKTVRLPARAAERTEGEPTSSSPLAPLDPPPGEVAPPEAVEPENSAPSADRTEAVLRHLLHLATGRSPGDTFRVRLEDLRRDVDPEGTGVRRVGSLLGRHGVLSRVEGTEEGPAWVLRSDRLVALRDRAAADSPTSADISQPS